MDEDSLKRILLGASIGVVLTAFAGFGALGWKTDTTARDMAKQAANASVIEALAPICVDRFQRAADATQNKVALMKVGAAEQALFVEKGGWATLPPSSSANSAVAQACAKMLSTVK
jgi:hypothetical protein